MKGRQLIFRVGVTQFGALYDDVIRLVISGGHDCRLSSNRNAQFLLVKNGAKFHVLNLGTQETVVDFQELVVC